MLDPAITLACNSIALSEGCILTPYLCPAGYWTIGIGSRFLADGSPVTATTKPITKDQAISLLSLRVTADNTYLDHIVTVKLTTHQRAALLSWMYNVGHQNAYNSTLIRLINNSRMTAAAEQFLVWDKEHVDGKLVASTGLLARRKRERTLFLTNDSPTMV